MKYVIEIEKRPFRRADSISVDFSEELYRVEGFKSLVFDKNGLDKLEPLTTEYINEHFSDIYEGEYEVAYQKGYDEARLIYQNPHAEADYQKGLDEAWDVARKLVAYWYADDDDVFEDKSFVGFLDTYTASEAIAKLTAYEETKKADSEIKVGDEITSTYSGERGPAVVVQVTRGDVYYVYADGRTGNNPIASDSVKKTGRHFPEVAELLKKMKGGAE